VNILLTGGTGYIGSKILDELTARGDTVTALVRSDASAARVAESGATPVQGDLRDLEWLTGQLERADAAVHTAAASDPSEDAVTDQVVAQAVVSTFGGTTKPYVHTSGIWIWGDGSDLTENLPRKPPAQTAWRLPIEETLLSSEVAVTVLAPGIVYGYGTGIPALVTSGPRTDSGALALIGSGDQHWTTVHVDDLARLYLRVLEEGSRLGYLLGVNGTNPTVRELSEAVAGDAGVEPGSVEEARTRLGDKFADALLLDQQASGAKARALGWQPTEPSLVEELRSGSYASS
jgi:nucleoside-diphosphate-sugar epimerase